jgi:sarcosine reductase
MKLEIQDFEVHSLEFGKTTAYSDGVLSVHKEELVGLICEDRRIKDVDIKVAHPGDKTRVTNVLEISDARIKGEGSYTYYPGMASGLFRAGQGKTNVLRGCAVLEIGSIPGFFGGVIDMTGEGARLTPYSKTHNLCILTSPSSEMEKVEYGLALKQAGLKTSIYLAEATRGKTPHEVKVFDINLPEERLHGLPRVGYLFQLHSHGDSREPFVYGDNSRRYYPTILHPNEILDGAIVCGHYDISPALKNTTYSLLNHPVILDLYERHGKELNFRGVVIAPEPTTLDEIKRMSMMSAGLLKNVLGVEGVIITKEGGGHTDVDMMRNCDECEKMGIKTVLIDNEWLGPDGTGQPSLLDMSVNANAMVSVGNVDEDVELPPMEIIIGGETMADIPGDLKGKASIPIRSFPNAISQLGLTFLTARGR